ncbi:hypothetical protein GF351_02160 [Candidatus Woesearchaeota archaeon]|nr:hypothetical protein [Candidatus Woesearchaeota archaeon]
MTAVVTGAILGIFCIMGVGYRIGYAGNELFLFATWFNRVLMGLVIGLAGSLNIMRPAQRWLNPYIRGAALGLIVSFAFFASTGFLDTTGFYAGIVYGVIIDAVASKLG